MKTSLIKFNRFLAVAAVAAGCLAVPLAGKADPPKLKLPDPLGLFSKKKSSEPRRDEHDHDHDHRGHDHDRDERYRRYSAQPRSTFILSFGTGYAGQGYYYGPPNSPYYYQTPGVVYYRNREAVPRQYYPREWNSGPGYRGPSPSPSTSAGSADAAVQRALSRRGYYNGPIDGDIGPGTRAAIARYQRDAGLRPTGVVDSTLLRSLGL